MNHYIDFNKVHELAMVVTQRMLQCFYSLKKTGSRKKIRPNAQKPNAKACHANNITLSHHLLTLSILGLELLQASIEVSCWSVSICTVAKGKMTWFVE